MSVFTFLLMDFKLLQSTISELFVEKIIFIVWFLLFSFKMRCN